MNDLHLIESTLAGTARRRRLDRALRSMWTDMFASAGAWLVLLAAYKLAPIPDFFMSLSWGIIPAGALIGFIWGWSRPVSLDQTARWVDGKRHLQERLSTALELSRTTEDSKWKNLILSDAARSVTGLNNKEIVPLRLPRVARWALVLLVLGAGLGFVPEYRSKTFVQKQKDTEAIKQTGRELANLTKRTLQTHPPAIESTRKSLEEVLELGNQMTKAQLTRSEALKNLSNVAEKLKEQERELAKNNAVRNLERAARNASSKSSGTSSELQQKLENMAKQSGANAANPDAMEKMKQDLQKARDLAANLPKGDTPEAKAARDKLQASLADMAKQAKDLGMDLPTLSEAIAALQNAQPDQVLKDLQMAEVDLDKMEAMAKALDKMQIDSQRLGKDLAEQLKNGQAEAAESTLRKMEKALQAGKIAPEEMNKIMSEVSKALGAAKPYGEVADDMKAAMKSMQSGDKASASASLGKAASALAKMAGELGDAQSLLASMEALQQAEMSIANGQGFGQMPGRQRGKGKGNGKSGGGVGTWHDEDSWVYPEFTEHWDNSGVQEKNLDENRSNTQRGDGELADSLAPTKIKGQITPGGPMPSITMKGVSIKGTSKVQIQEMATAAQSEAQSALNQDQVPRAYQNAVKNYFDDLKE
jgi:hypothetical protein